MAEEKIDSGNTPPAFTFGEEATPRTSQEFFEGASGTSDCRTTTSDDFFEDLWNAYNRLSYSPDVTGHTHVTESGITSSPPTVSSSSINHAKPGTSRVSMEEASAIPENLASNSDDAWCYQWNTQPKSITDGTYNVDGTTHNGSASYLHQGFISCIDHATHSTSRIGMEEASAFIESGARIPETTRVDQWNTLYHLADSTSTDCGHTGHTETRSTGFTLPVFISSPVTSTSYARMQGPSGVFGNDAWNATGTGGREQQELSGACSIVSSRQDALHGHAKEHAGDSAYTCKASDSVYNSVKHSRNTTGKNHKCATCGKMFRRAANLAVHHRTHTNEKPYKCDICEKSFRQSYHRDIHKRTHTGERPYTCKTCGKSFADSSNLRKHNNTHTDEKHHVCQKCGKPFKTKKSLKHHDSLCWGDRAFVYEICTASFKNNSALDRHRRSHMDETPHYVAAHSEMQAILNQVFGREHLCSQNMVFEPYRGAQTTMAEESDSGNTPPAFTFGEEATPRTSQEFFEGASGTSDCRTTTRDDFFEDLWNAFKSLSYSQDVTSHARVTESRITRSPPMASSISINPAQPSTSRAGMEEASAIPENLASNSDDAWRYQWNTQPKSITDGTYNVHGITHNGSASYLHQGFISCIDHATHSTSRIGMEEASAFIESGARIPETTRVDQWNTLYHLADSTSTDCGHTGHTETRSTGFTLPVCSSSPVASTSYARMQEPSGVFGNDAWNATGTGGREQQELSGACSNVSSRQDALHGHAKEHTGDSAYTCKASDSVNNSVKHSRNTTGKNHKCATCGKMFRRAGILATHYRTHTNEKPYKCEICDKSFRQSSHRDVHKRTHTGERPYTCKTCGKSFAHSSNLRKHNYTHTDEKHHVCQKCGKPFKTKYSLKHHHNLCWGDRAFVCEICTASFKNNSALDRHRRNQMDETPH
ncbi:zinc finger protein 665-like [Dermacentor albipictus]|uniref:zinc finger protein 665-like n=1 Tax=Dermacentor albipictus TaxID=60249 RepID=UPI0038FCBD2B